MSTPALPCPTEHDEQADVVRWAGVFARHAPALELLYAVPNGSFRHPATAARLRLEGVRAGVPDLHLPVARRGFCGLWLELKRRRTGRVTEPQAWWQDRLRQEGHAVVVAYGADVAVAVLGWYVGLRLE